MALIYNYLPRYIGIPFFSLGVFAAISYDVVRTRIRYTTPFRSFLELVVRPKERGSIGGQTYFLVGALFTAILFPKHPAIVGMTITSISDALAAIFGRRWRKYVFMEKSVEGVGVAIVSGVVATTILCGFSPILSLGIATSILISEISSVVVDDNLVYPVLTASSVYFLG